MGEIKILGDKAFRDYVDDGYPGSGYNQPDKQEIRDTIDKIDSIVSGLEVSGDTVTKATWVQLLAIAGTRNGQRGYVEADSGTHTDPVVGGVVPNAGIYTWSTSPAGWRWLRADDTTEIKKNLEVISAEQSGSALLTASDLLKEDSAELLQSRRLRTVNTWPVSSGLTGWFFAFLPDKIFRLSHVSAMVSCASTANNVDIKLWRRQLSDIALATAPGSAAGDRLILTKNKLLSDILGAGAGWAYANFDLSEAGTVSSDYLYIAEISARSSGGALVPMGIGSANALAGDPTWMRGWYRNASNGIGAITGTGAISYRVYKASASGPDKSAAVTYSIAEDRTKSVQIAAVERIFSGGAWSVTDAFYGFQSGCRPMGYTDVSAVRVRLEVPAANAKVGLRIYRRSVLTNDVAFGTVAGDDVCFERLYEKSEIGLATTLAEATFAVDENLIMSPDFIYGIEVFALTADLSGYTAIGAGQSALPTSEFQWQRGFYTRNAAIGSWSNTSSNTLAIRVDKVGYLGASDVSASVKDRVKSAVVEIQSFATFSVTLQPFTLEKPSGSISVPSTSVTFDAPATLALSGSITLTYNASPAKTPSLPSLHRYISGVAVTRNSNNAVLVPGTDYLLLSDRGYIGLLSEGTGVPCTYVATGHSMRYDLVSLNPDTGAIVITKGTDRARDPEFYQPALPAGNVALYKAYVTRYGVDLIPLHQFDGLARNDRVADHAAWKQYCRSCLPKTLKRLENGQALKLLGYGDSITAMGGGGISPNGSMRDLKSYLNGLPADTLATIPTFDGDAGSGMHVRLGWNWLLKAALEERYDSVITYLNYGWGGTTSATGENNGLDPNRFNPVLAEGPSLMVLAFGMNELGNAGTYANVRSIIEQCKAVGMEVVVITTPRVNSDGNPTSMVNWLKTHDYLVRAARDTRSAYVSLYELSGIGFEGAMGLSPKNLCSQNLYNHPWPKEFERIGDLISSVFQ